MLANNTNRSLATRLIDLSLIAPKGFTIHSETFSPLEQGFTVGGVYTSYEGRHLFKYWVPSTEAERLKLIDRLEEVIHDVGDVAQLQQEAFWFGGWSAINGLGEVYYLDVTTVYESKVAAEAVAKERKQLAFSQIAGFKWLEDFQLETEVN
jgi:hypothetical protein